MKLRYFIFFFAFSHLLCQQKGENRSGARCEGLADASSQQLVEYLQADHPARSDDDCITYALLVLGQRQYEPSLPILIKYLEFKPYDPIAAKYGVKVMTGGQRVRDNPARAAILEFGPKAEHSLLNGIVEPSQTIHNQEIGKLELLIHHDRQELAIKALVEIATKPDASPLRSQALFESARWLAEQCKAEAKSACRAELVQQ
jgi:hypothetical protein